VPDDFDVFLDRAAEAIYYIEYQAEATANIVLAALSKE
jgi:hypothetical protein